MIDTRYHEKDFSVRRRRECINEKCALRFGSTERFELHGLLVDKRQAKHKEAYDETKLRRSLEAVLTDHVHPERVNELLWLIKHSLIRLGQRVILSSQIASCVMSVLQKEEQTQTRAYVRYASQYQNFVPDGAHTKQPIKLSKRERKPASEDDELPLFD